MAASIGSERGQASVELVAVLPVVLVVGAVVWQLALVGHAAWLTANAARAAARAEIVGRSGVSVRVPWVLTSRPTPIRIAAVSSLGGRQSATERARRIAEPLLRSRP